VPELLAEEGMLGGRLGLRCMHFVCGVRSFGGRGGMGGCRLQGGSTSGRSRAERGAGGRLAESVGAEDCEVWDLLKRMKVGESLLAAHALTISYGGPPSEAQPPVWGESCFILLPPISLPTPHIGTCVGIGAGTRAHLDRFCIPPSTLTKIPSPQRV